MALRAYNARHAEYVPPADSGWRYLYEPEWNEDADPVEHADAVRHFAAANHVDAASVEAVLHELDDDVEHYFVIVVDDERRAEVFQGLLADVLNGPQGGDDDVYDYWPSGVLLAYELAPTAADADKLRAGVRGLLERRGLTDELSHLVMA